MDADEVIAEENRRLVELKALVDRAQAEIREGKIPESQVEDAIAGLRRESERLFPDKGRTFDLIYEPRLLRAAREHLRDT